MHLTVNFNPVAFSIFNFDVYWYGIAYLCGILLGSFYLSILDKKSTNILNKHKVDQIVIYAIIGIILGGRVGYILFYGSNILSFYDYFNLRLGGMSFHGGLIGTIISLSVFCHKNKLSKLVISDLIFVVVPIGIMFGRIANFINGELYGRVTHVPWAMIFKNADHLPRHPSQLYEAFLEGLLPLIILSLLHFKFKLYRFKGMISGIYISWYGISRVIIENFREPDHHLGFIFMNVTMGQLLSIPMLLIGVFLIKQSLHNKYTSDN